MSQRNQEKDCNGKRSFPKEERTLEGRTEKKPQEKNDQNADLERNPLLRRDMDNETDGHSKTGGFRNMDMAKNGKNQLDGTYIERKVLILVGEERSVIPTISARQRNWMGPLRRGDSLQRELMEGRMEGKRG